MFLTTHFMDEAEDLADVVCFIHNGRIVEMGKPFELKKKYGEAKIKVLFENGSGFEQKEFSLDNEGLASATQLSHQHQVLSIQSQEASLKDIFIRLLSDEETP